MKLLSKILVAFALLPGPLWTAAIAQPLPASSLKADTAPSMIRVATVAERIQRDRHDFRVYEANRLLSLPWFSELAVAVPVDPRLRLDSLLGNSVGLVPSQKSMKEWDLYSNVVGMGPTGRYAGLTLAENVFRVRKVILCTHQRVVELRMDGWVYRLKPGQALIVLG